MQQQDASAAARQHVLQRLNQSRITMQQQQQEQLTRSVPDSNNSLAYFRELKSREPQDRLHSQGRLRTFFHSVHLQQHHPNAQHAYLASTQPTLIQQYKSLMSQNTRIQQPLHYSADAASQRHDVARLRRVTVHVPNRVKPLPMLPHSNANNNTNDTNDTNDTPLPVLARARTKSEGGLPVRWAAVEHQVTEKRVRSKTNIKEKSNEKMAIQDKKQTDLPLEKPRKDSMKSIMKQSKVDKEIPSKQSKVEKEMPNITQDDSSQDAKAKRSFTIAKGNVACPHCGRPFAPDRLEVHEKICGKPKTRAVWDGAAKRREALKVATSGVSSI